MNLSEYVFKKANPIAITFPIVAPMGTVLPFLTYTLDGQEQQKTTSDGGVTVNSVTVTAYEEEYDSSLALAEQIENTFNCSAVEDSIIGTTVQSITTEYIKEPISSYATSVELNIYTRI